MVATAGQIVAGPVSAEKVPPEPDADLDYMGRGQPTYHPRLHRCLVPANSFAEYAPEPNPATGKKDVVWVALNHDRSRFAFGGIWTEFKGNHGTKSKPIFGPHLACGFSDHCAERDR